MTDGPIATKAKEEDRRLDREETPHENASHKLRPKRSLASIGRSIHLGRSGTRRNITQSLRSPPSPSYSSRRNASLQSSRHNSLSSLSPGRSTVAAGHQPEAEQTDADDDEEEPDPALLGSFDYHNFLCNSSNRRTALTMSPAPIAQPAHSTPKHSSNINVFDRERSNFQTSLRSNSISSQCFPASASIPPRQQAVRQNL